MMNASADDALSEAVDLTVLMSFEEAQADGDPDLIVELIDLYLEDTLRLLALMREALANADEATLRRAAHNLKGSSANLGARRMAALCDELEHANGNLSLQQTCALLNGLEQEFERVRSVFADERRRRL